MNPRSGNRGYRPIATDPMGESAPHRVILNRGSDDELHCTGYRDNACKKVLYYILGVISLGTFFLVMYWRPDWAVKLKKSECPLSKADTVVLKDQYGALTPEPVICQIVKDGILRYSTFSSKHAQYWSPSDYFMEEDAPSTGEDDTTVLTIRSRSCFKYFDHHHVRYIFDKNIKSFKKLRGLDNEELTCAVIHDNFTDGLSEEEEAQKLHIYGENSIEVEVKSYWRLFIEEVLNPFYIFQIASIILWSLDDYYIYASCIFFISAISLGVELYETRKQRETLRDMVSSTETTVTVCRGGNEIAEIPTKQLVPGDVIIIPSRGCMMTCDAVLVSGNAIVNESMLTGESVPVTKTPLAQSEANEIYSPEVHKRHTLFCGTHVIQTRYYGDAKVKAVVVRTGFSTAKGQLVQSIMYPKPMGFQFYKDAMKFILMLFGIALCGMTYSIVMMIHLGAATGKVVLRALDIITIVVPPALPAAMTVGTVYAQNRLKKQGIFCISPPRINVCGKLNLVCFDKTGTLTEDGLDMWGVVPLQDKRFLPAMQNPTDLPTRGPFLVAMATCHSLTIIDGELTGDPLDLKMFNSTNWILEEPGRDTSKFDTLVPTVVRPVTKDVYYVDKPEKDDTGAVKTPFEVGIVRQFTFSSGLQRMSVITRVLGARHMEVYCKGAPEKIVSLCNKETIPEDFHEVLQRYTMRGFRVIALAWKTLDSKMTWQQVQRMSRDAVESELTFLGLLIMENTLKPQTTPVIHQLNEADIRTVMVTGDNMLTAISVARQCGMVAPRDHVILVHASGPEAGKPAKIHWEYAETDPVVEEDEDSALTSNTETEMLSELYQASPGTQGDPVRYHFAVTGRSFGVLRHYFPELMPKICVRGTVFARMSPDQKSHLVEHLQALGFVVGMCGDGANDCGALKTAHAGISLSEAEASVASPFTSRTANIECVPTVIREGRAALVTSFGVFKYMALYSIIQFVSVLILYTFASNLGDWMFLYIDLVITTTIAVLMGHTGAYHKLVKKRPPGSLVKPSNVFSIVVNIIIVAAFQAGTYLYLETQPWFTPVAPKIGQDNVVCFETTTVFLVSSFQYLILAFVFSKGPPYRKRIWTNVLFLIALILLTGCTTLLVMHPFPFLVDLLTMKEYPDEAFMFRVTILGIVAVNFLLCFILETFILPSSALSALCNVLRRKKQPKNRYKLLEKELEENPSWPPVGEFTIATGNLALDISELIDSTQEPPS